MNKKTISVAISATALIAATTAQANMPPRGVDIEDLAANCEIGHIPQTSKAGEYTVLCNTLTDAEKCLAFIKSQLRGNTDYKLTPVDQYDESQIDRAKYCISTFLNELL